MFARVPLALAEVNQTILCVLLDQALEQLDRIAALGRAHRVAVPFRTGRIVDGNKRWFAAHGQTHVAVFQFAIDFMTQRLNGSPLLVGVRLGDTRCFEHALHRHAVVEFDLALFDTTADRRRFARLGRAGERNVSFASKQA